MIILFSTGRIFEQADKIIMNKILNFFDSSEASYIPFKISVTNFKDDYIKLIEEENQISNGNYHLLMVEVFEENKVSETFVDFEDIKDEILLLNEKYAVEGHIQFKDNPKDYVFSGVKRKIPQKIIQDVPFDFQKELQKDIPEEFIVRGLSKKNQRDTFINQYTNTNRRKGKSLRERINEDVLKDVPDNIGGLHKRMNERLYDYVNNTLDENTINYDLDQNGYISNLNNKADDGYVINPNNNIIAHYYDTWY